MIIPRPYGQIVVFPAPDGLRARFRGIEGPVLLQKTGRGPALLVLEPLASEIARAATGKPPTGRVLLALDQDQEKEACGLILAAREEARKAILEMLEGPVKVLRDERGVRLISPPSPAINPEAIQEVAEGLKEIARRWKEVPKLHYEDRGDPWEGRVEEWATIDGRLILEAGREALARKEATKQLEQAKRIAAIEEAKKTGKEVVVGERFEVCNDPYEECSLDIVREVALPTGAVILRRIHTR